MNLLYGFCGVGFIWLAVTVWSACVLSGWISRREEKGWIYDEADNHACEH